MTTFRKLSFQFLFAIVFSLVFSGHGYGQKKLFRVDNAIPNKYIVVLNDDTTGDISTIAQNLASEYGGTVGLVYQHALKGFSIEMGAKRAAGISEDEQVKYITEDSEMYLTYTQTNAPYNLDRIDQRDLPLSTTFNYDGRGQGVAVYVIDSGIVGHYEFTNWPNSSSRVFPGPNFAGGANVDCNGHGTHIAGIAAGDTYGVAKRAFIVPVRVFPCTPNSPVSTVVAGVDWVRANHVARSVANLSFSGSPNQAIDDAVRNLVASGIQCVIAAGNNGLDANNYSPARVREALTVGNINITDTRDSLSNYGTAIDVFAPGENITAAGLNNTLDVKSGTSQAAALVSGAIALYMGDPTYYIIPNPSELQNLVTANASANKISNVGPGSPNLLYYTGQWYYGIASMPFYRHKNFSTNSNLYVMGWDELGGGKNGYVMQEVEGYLQPYGDNYTNGPLYRYYNAAINDYVYTMNWSEFGNGANGYVFEKVEGYLRWSTNGGPVLYRYWNPGISKHYYTSNFAELGNGANGYIYEGITGYFL